MNPEDSRGGPLTTDRPTAENPGEKFTAHRTPYCMTYGFASEDEACADCSQLVVGYSVGRFVTVGRLGGARLCDTCAESSGLHDLAVGLDHLDTFVNLPDGMNRAAAVMNLQAAVQSLLDQEWLPLVQADLEQARLEQARR